jgi:hypothetical protein
VPFNLHKNQASFFIFSSSLIKIQYYYYAHIVDYEALRDIVLLLWWRILLFYSIYFPLKEKGTGRGAQRRRRRETERDRDRDSERRTERGRENK